MAVAFAEEVPRIHEVGGRSDAQIGRAVGAAPSRSAIGSRSVTRRTGGGLAGVVDRLVRVVDADYIPVWFSRPISNPPAGGLVHTAGFDERAGVVRIFDVWESEEA